MVKFYFSIFFLFPSKIRKISNFIQIRILREKQDRNFLKSQINRRIKFKTISVEGSILDQWAIDVY